MQRFSGRWVWGVVTIALLCLPGHAAAQQITLPALSVDEIAARLQQHQEERQARLKGYTSRRWMTVSYSGFFTHETASEEVEMTYIAPGTKRFRVVSATGPSFLRDHVFAEEIDKEQRTADPHEHAALALTSANYHLRLAGTQVLPQGDCYMLDVSPRTSNPLAFSGRVWVQSPEFAVVKIVATPEESPSFLLHGGTFTAIFNRVGRAWLPEQTISSSHVRLGGVATFTIRFGDYKLDEAEPTPAASTAP